MEVCIMRIILTPLFLAFKIKLYFCVSKYEDLRP